MSELTLPILDLSLLDQGPDAAARFRDDLRAATHDVGFFYLTGTGVSAELESRLLQAAKDFFALPDADKLAIENVTSPHFRGYTRVGGELTQGRVDWREQIDIGPEREPLVDPDGPGYNRLVGPNLWPAAQPELREVVAEWHDHLTGIARKLLRAWALSLGAEEQYFDRHFGDPQTLIKIVRYPGKDDPTPQQGVGAHKDSGVLTLLWVEPGKGGLQVERDGEWVDAP
ncbi:isopenicillin N synthase family oxygenase, partial [uncultured Microbacterium sp.]